MRCEGAKGGVWSIFLSLFTFFGDCLHTMGSLSPIHLQGIYLTLKTTESAARESFVHLVMGMRSEHVVGSVSFLPVAWFAYKTNGSLTKNKMKLNPNSSP